MKKFFSGFIVGILVLYGTSAIAASVKQFVLTEASYPIYVNGVKYEDDSRPILNYEGSTYIPLAKLGDLMGVDYSWNEELRRVEINTDSAVGEIRTPDYESVIFRELVEEEAIRNYQKNDEFHFEYVDEPMIEPTADEVIEAITNLHKKELTEEEKQFLENWIGEKELSEKHNIAVYRFDRIIFSKRTSASNLEKIFEINNVPYNLETGKVYEGGGIRYQYNDGLYFYREDLKRLNILP